MNSKDTIIRAFFENSSELYLVIDNQFNVIDANKIAVSSSRTDNLIGSNLHNIIPNFEGNPRYKAWKHTIDTGEEVVLNEVVPHPKFGNKIFEIKSFKILDNLFGLILIDITKQKEKEEALQRTNAELNQFAYAVSHNLKAPMRALSQLTDFLLTTLDEKNIQSDEIEKISNFIKSRATKMHDFIESILDYSKFTMVGQNKTSENVVLLIESIIESLFVEKRFNIILDESLKSLPAIFVDKLKLQQIFLNLIDNAIVYNDKDKPQIIIHGFDEISTNNYTFIVEDNGPGIDSQYHDKIFEIFQSLHLGDQKHNSTGIGLSLVKSLVLQCGGTIRVESEMEKGSKFIFTIAKN